MPFEGSSSGEICGAILHTTPTPVLQVNPQVPAEVEAIINKALEKDREVRYQHASDIEADLQRLTRDNDSWRTVSSALTRPHKRVLKRAALGLGALLLAAGISLRLERNGGAIDSIAVLPFINVAADPKIEYLSDGVTESLTNSLSELPHLTVMSRNAVLRYKGQEIDAQAAGRELKVNAVLIGRIVQRGDALSINVELVDVAKNGHIWGQEYERSPSDLLAIQQEIVREISVKLGRRFTGEGERRLAKRSTTNPEAYQYYLKGRYFTEKFTRDGINKGIDYFHQAIKLDPNYALAYAGLAYVYSDASDDFFLSPQESMPNATTAARKALELDDTLPEAHLEMGIVHYSYDFDWSGAEKELRRSIELDPNYAHAHEFYGWYLILMGRTEHGIDESKRALELDPLSAETGATVGQNFYYAHQYDLAIDTLHKTLDLAPDYWIASMFLGLSYERKGDLSGALTELEQASATSTVPWPSAELGHAAAVSGEKTKSQEILTRLKERSKQSYVSAYNLAEIYIGLGDKEQALASLEQAYEDRSMLLTFLEVDPELDSLHSDPRFMDLVRRIGLPQ